MISRAGKTSSNSENTCFGGAAHQRVEILRPSFPERGETAVHPCADDSERRGEINLVAGLLHAAGKRHIFQNFAGDCGMAADFLIDVAQDHQELAVGGGVREFRIIDAREENFAERRQ